MDQSGAIETREDFKQDPKGQYDFWSEELKASQKAREKWHKQGNKIVKRYLDARSTQVDGIADKTNIPFRLNLFHSNVNTIKSMLYGNVPQVDVSRRYADSNDDVARVAAEAVERLLNNDIAENGQEYDTVLRSTLLDRLLPGLGCARVRYEFETETTEIEIIKDGQLVLEESEEVTEESAPCDYFYWGDVLWGWGRNFSELPWLAYRSFLTKDEVKARGEAWEEIADDLTYKKQLPTEEKDGTSDPDMASVWQKAEIWEIWDKEARKVHYVSITGGVDKVIETKADPLELKQFFPSPPFFLANPTTSLYQPTPDFTLAQDLYNEIDLLQTRISILTTAVKAVGVYDSSAEGIERIFTEGTDNTLIPVSNWALFGEKGGLAGAIDWVPLNDIVNALEKLRQIRDETIGLLYQVTGMSDIMRGDAGQYEGVGQTELKAKMGSIRIQALQDEFAQFASDLLQLKYEVIARHFEPRTIAKMANMEYTMDALGPDGQPSPEGQKLIADAINLIKHPDEARLRVVIRPESVAMVDYAQLKGERTDYLNALSTFMQSSAPLMEQDPAAKPFLLQLLQWGLAGFKGASEIEGVIDKAIEASTKQAQEAPEKPDPAMQAAQMAQQLEQMKAQNTLAAIQAKAAASQAERQQDRDADIATAQAQSQMKIQERQADLQATLAELQAKMVADLTVENAQLQSNLAQNQATVEGEIQKDVVTARLDVEKEGVKSANKINEIATSAAAKIKEAAAKPSSAKGDNDGQ